MAEAFNYDEKDDEKSFLHPPSLTRRMSTQFAVHMDRQRSMVEETVDNINLTLNQYIPTQIIQHIPSNMPIITPTQELKPTYFCHICFTKKDIQTGFTLTNCKHQFCPDCINAFMENKINNNIVNFSCFYPIQQNNPCGQTIDANDIHKIVNPNIWRKYKKFKCNKRNIYSRQCPYCDHTQIGNPKYPMMSCTNHKCGLQYCLYHSNAHHIHMSCEQYELSMAKQNRINAMAISEMAGGEHDNIKKCPQCGCIIIKNGGCNHMKCVKCNCSFCWLCLEMIQDDELPFHYKDPNSPCKGQQFAGLHAEMPGICTVILLVICMLILCIPAAALAIVFASHPVLDCCCNRQREPVSTRVCGCWLVWLILLMFIFVLVPVLILSCIWKLLKGLYEMIPCCAECPNEEVVDDDDDEINYNRTHNDIEDQRYY